MDNYGNFNGSTERLCGQSPTVIVKISSEAPNAPALTQNEVNNHEKSEDYMGSVYGDDFPTDDFNFQNASIRSSFIRKVFLIISIQFAITSGITSWFMFDAKTKYFVQKNESLLIITAAINLMILVIVLFCGELRKQFPVNYAFLFTFTVGKAFLVATVTSFYNIFGILVAVGLISLDCLALSLFASQTTFEFNVFKGSLFSVAFIFACFGLFCVFLVTDILHLVYASLCAIIISIYFVYDIKSMIQGSHTYDISPYECIFAALCVFIDIPNVIFGVCFHCVQES